ncbi:MAG: hypothetical protein IKR73_00350 [Oscillospiraceae bacterium]|nr:hypothetical protein [Oscillospiraceae bacterium]
MVGCNEINLHHIGQKDDPPLAELTESEHRMRSLHDPKAISNVDRNEAYEDT